MAFKNLSFLTLFVVISFLASLSIAANNAAPTMPPVTICASTEDPSYCKPFLPTKRATSMTMVASLSESPCPNHKSSWTQWTHIYLQSSSSSLSQLTIGALQDCKFLAELNLEYLSSTQDSVDKSSSVLQSFQAEDVVTSLSAILTNQQTCLEGLQTTASDERVKNDLSSTLNDDTKLHNSVSLALFMKGWDPEEKITTSSSQPSGDKGRKLLQTSSGGGSVKVKGMVVVSKDGSDNFTTINFR